MGKVDRMMHTSTTTLYDPPLEVLDMIFKKSFLHWILNSSTKQRDEKIIRSLISVDVCFYRRITRRRFKREICRNLKDFYERNKKHLAICRNNKDFLLKNIQPNDDFIDSLLSLNCITEEQRQLIQRQNSDRDKNAELLKVVRSYDNKRFSDFARCLRQTNQTEVAKIIENGGVAIKVRVKTSANATAESMDTQLLHQRRNNLQNKRKERSHETDRLIVSQLKIEEIEILDTQLKRQTVVVWIWCRSQATLENIHKMYESNMMIEMFFEENQLSTAKIIKIDKNQFRKTVVVCPISINFTQCIKMPGDERADGVTKLRNRIYVICRLNNYSSRVIRVFEDRNPCCFQTEFKIKEMRDPVDIVSNEKENCLYVHDYREKFVWKITIETYDNHKLIKWLSTDYKPRDTGYMPKRTLSVTSDGHLLVVNESSPSLMIYASDAKLIRSIQLPKEIERISYAVETSIGNFMIVYNWGEVKSDELSGDIYVDRFYRICELSKDGETVVRRFIPSNERQRLSDPRHLSLDSDDRVFVADTLNSRVVLLDSDLKWNRILLSQIEGTKDTKVYYPNCLCYDSEKNQLIVVDNGSRNITLFAVLS